MGEQPLEWACFEVPATEDEGGLGGAPGLVATFTKPATLLASNVRWFCRLRWLVAAALAAYGVLGAPAALVARGLAPVAGGWPFAVAGFLVLANVGYLLHAGRFREGAPEAARWNIWAQIVVDLVAITVVVHFVGSLDTPVAYAYLFHVTLACIFFTRWESLVVAVAASSLYLACAGLEFVGVLGRPSIYADDSLVSFMARAPLAAWVNLASLLVVVFLMWHLVSHLGELLRDKERLLQRSGDNLQRAHHEKVRHMLRTTHELKAPFAAIQAYGQLLVRGDCGPLPPAAVDVGRKIMRRCRHLATEIQQMLQLANLETASEKPLTWEELDVAQVVRESAAKLQTLAAERRVTVEVDLPPCATTGVLEHLTLLVDNLLANAILYSYEGGLVRITGKVEEGGGSVVSIEDRGIGIVPHKLPRIFEEYYRTDEAARHNKDSTGLGLAIVRRVALVHRITLRVESAVGSGTTFTLLVPPVGWRKTQRA